MTTQARPNNFRMNSDFLSVAQVSSNEYTVNIDAGSVTSSLFTTYREFSIEPISGAIDRVQISYDGDTVGGCTGYIKPSSDAYAGVQIYRDDPSTLRVNLTFFPYGGSSGSWDDFSFLIKVDSFKPPNLI